MSIYFTIVDYIVQVETFMRTSVSAGDAEMVRMLISAKVDVNNRGSNVSAGMHGIVRACCVLCTWLNHWI